MQLKCAHRLYKRPMRFIVRYRNEKARHNDGHFLLCIQSAFDDVCLDYAENV